MDVQLITLLNYLSDRLSADERVTVDRALATSAPLRAQFERLRIAVGVVREDAQWQVPVEAIDAAKTLGRRLDALRPATVFQQLAAAIEVLVAKLTFDSRTEQAFSGLRGETGFALIFEVDDLEFDLECALGDDERFRVVGQVTTTATRKMKTVEAWDADFNAAAPLATESIGPTGMFRLALPAGRYRLRFKPLDPRGVPVELQPIELTD